MRRPSQVSAAVIAGGMAVLAATFVMFWAPGSGAQTATPPTVTLQNTAYNPAALSLPAPGIVRFVHRDGETPHSVTGGYEGQTASNSNFDSHPNCSPSGDLRDCWQESDSNSSVDVNLESPGTFRYHCKIHAAMTGVITVAGTGGTVPAVTTTAGGGPTTTRKSTNTTVGTLTTTSEVTTTTSTSESTTTLLTTTTTSLQLTTQTTAPGTALGNTGDDDDDEPSGVLYAVGVILLAAAVAGLIPAWRRLA